MKRWEHIAERVNAATARPPWPLTKGEVAKRLDMSRPRLDRRLNGDTEWEYDKLEQLANLLGVTLEELVGENSVNDTTVGGTP